MVDPNLLIKEFLITTSRSSGAGGQHVNKVETRVRVCFQIGASKAISEEQKKLLFDKYSNKINKQGFLCVSSQKHRDQLSNKERAIEKMVRLIQDGLKPVKKRKKTRVPKSEKEKRLAEKKGRSAIKELRKKIDP